MDLRFIYKATNHWIFYDTKPKSLRNNFHKFNGQGPTSCAWRQIDKLTFFWHLSQRQQYFFWTNSSHFFGDLTSKRVNVDGKLVITLFMVVGDHKMKMKCSLNILKLIFTTWKRCSRVNPFMLICQTILSRDVTLNCPSSWQTTGRFLLKEKKTHKTRNF